MQFLYPILAWGFLLVGLPALIHLINMLRHRKRKWAAMEFLLESHRKNRRWVMLKQWLLLLARMLAITVLVLLLARWVSKSEWLSALGGQTTHHYVLLDDSYSMGQSGASTTAYREAITALTGLVKSISAEPGEHQLTLLRYSRASLALRSLTDESQDKSDEEPGDAEVGISAASQLSTAADLSGQSVPRDPEKLLDRISATEPSGLATDAQAALEMISLQISNSPEQSARVYMLTDVRRRDFGEATELKDSVKNLAQQGAEFSIVTCDVPSSQPNASIVSVAAPQDVWAAGVPLQLGFQIRNHSDQPIRNLVVQLKSISYASAEPDPQKTFSGVETRLPPIVIEQLGPRETITRRAQVLFSEPGSHVVELSLPEDALKADNRRWATINIADSQRILLVDGDAARRNAYFIEALMAPDRRITTGIEVDTEDDVFLRDTAAELIDQYDVICLLDVPRLDVDVVDRLTQYVQSGGGLLFLAGPNTNLSNLETIFYADGAGPFPAPVEAIEEFPLDSTSAQIQLADHPIFEPLAGMTASPFFALKIRKLLRLDAQALRARGCETVAETTDGLPLAVDLPLGEGHVVAALTGLTPEWSTWSSDPTFVVFMLRSVGYLGSFRREPVDAPVATPVQMVEVNDPMLPDAEVLLPARGTLQEFASRLRLEVGVEQEAPGQETAAGSAGEFNRVGVDVSLGESDRELVDAFLRPGVIEVWMTTAGGDRLVRTFSHNLSSQDGDLDTISNSELSRGFDGLPVRIVRAEAMSAGPSIASDSTQSTLWMLLFLVILIVEQMLAYWCSYHGASLGVSTSRVKGGVA